jgi:hypothetical protein
MMDVLLQLSRAMNSSSGVPLPDCREKAIDLLSDDKAFSLKEEGNLLGLFAENVAYADSYVATKKKEAHVLYANKLLSRKRKEAEERGF